MESLNISLTSMNIPYIKFGHGLNQLEDAHPRKLTAGGPQNDGLGKPVTPASIMAILGIYVKFLGGIHF